MSLLGEPRDHFLTKGSIFNTDLWVHAIYLFTECVTKSCDPLDWLIQTCYQSATETTFLTQKCFSVVNLITVSLNIVILTIVLVKLPKVTGLFIAINACYFFNVVFLVRQTAS